MEKTSDIDGLKSKSLSGFGAMLQRHIAVKGIFLAGNVLLARILAPQIFGAYAIITFTLQFFSTFADVGLGAALIQSKKEPTSQELSTTFWIQQGLVTLIFIIVYVVSPFVCGLFPSLPSETAWVIRLMAVGFFFTSLKTIPMILMEKRLDFRKIAVIEVTEQAVFYVIAVLCALGGGQIWSFVFATILKEVSGVIIAYVMTSWRPSRIFRPESVRGLVNFGLPVQLTNFLNFIKEGVTPLFIGYFSGAAGVGYVTWARTFAFVPLVISESFGRIAFPAFSLIQNDRELLRDAVEQSVRMMTFVLFPVTLLLAAFAPAITKVFLTEKWLPGLGAFYLYCTTPLMIGIMLPMYSAILARGKSGHLLRMSIMLVVLEWGLGVPFVMSFGFNGIALNQPILTALFFVFYRRILNGEGILLNLTENIYRQLLAALLATVPIRGIAELMQQNFVTLPILFLGGILLYVGIMSIVAKDIIDEFKGQIVAAFGSRKCA